MTPKLKKIIVAIIVVAILFIGWAVFLKPDPSAEVFVSGRETTSGTGTTMASGDARLIGSQISQALLKIQQIVLKRDVFENEAFKTLQDRSRPIIEEPRGRSNPFAPLGNNASVNSTVRQQTTGEEENATSTATGTSATAPSTPSAGTQTPGTTPR